MKFATIYYCPPPSPPFKKKIVDCGPLRNPTYGTVSFRLIGLQHVATYSCNEGFRLTAGEKQRVCQTSGVWSGTEPQCTGKGFMRVKVSMYDKYRPQIVQWWTVVLLGTQSMVTYSSLEHH